MAIQDYDISIEYCSGKDNLVADTLSRLLEKENATKMANKDGKIVLYALAIVRFAKPAKKFCPGAKSRPYFGTKNQRCGRKETYKIWNTW